ncbi:MAG: SRPBCC family protein [Bacteroidota bacterium]
MKPHKLVTETIIRRNINEVFDFFSKAENLNVLTPPELSFKILTPLPIIIKQGALIDYRIKLSGIPFNWQTEICTWQPPYRFVDQQLKGPYKIWHHEHKFEETAEGYTKMTDTVTFLSPGWILEPLINKLFVGKKVQEIFNYRTEQLLKLFPN